METIESLSERLEVLENQTRAVKRRLHCWRILACGLVMLGLVILPLAGGTAQEQSAYERAHWREESPPLSTSSSTSLAAPMKLSSPGRTCASSMAWGTRILRMAWAT
jgi:hypothetical protein